MSRPTPADPAGRAYLDLQNRARRKRRPTQALLVMYVLERFLARLAASPYADQFVLRAGCCWPPGTPDAPPWTATSWHAACPTTRAACSTVSYRSPRPRRRSRMRRIPRRYRADSDDPGGRPLHRRPNRNGCDGGRRKGQAAAGHQRRRPVTPAAESLTYPTLRPEHPPLRILGYPLATVLAEKLTTAITLGATNTRIRDYADIWTLTGRHDLDGDELLAALHATASHRKVELRRLSDVVADLATARAAAYSAYRRRLGRDADVLPPDFATVVADVVTFAEPVCTTPAIAGRRWRSGRRRWT